MDIPTNENRKKRHQDLNNKPLTMPTKIQPQTAKIGIIQREYYIILTSNIKYWIATTIWLDD